jgi:hypothetical protein
VPRIIKWKKDAMVLVSGVMRTSVTRMGSHLVVIRASDFLNVTVTLDSGLTETSVGHVLLDALPVTTLETVLLAKKVYSDGSIMMAVGTSVHSAIQLL